MSCFLCHIYFITYLVFTYLTSKPDSNHQILCVVIITILPNAKKKKKNPI